ncbi:MAG: hypothetical protein MUE34_11290 [Acidimicrobiales bacterium]|nr:hypothetical protein [Acidimicrobiales bacterium]
MLHPILAVAALLLTAVAIVDYFNDQPVTYDAEATLVVGQIDVGPNAVPGYTSANVTLAGSYSRFVDTDRHIEKMAELAGGGTTPEDVLASGEVSGSNVPESPLIRITATAATEEQAVSLAELASAALIDLVDDVNDATEENQELLASHAEAVRSLATAQAEVERLQRDLAFYLENNDAASAAEVQEQLDVARADFEQQQLRVDTLAVLFQESQRYRIEGSALQPLADAASVGSSRGSTLQLGIVLAVLGGLTVAIGFTWLVSNAGALLAIRRELVERYRFAEELDPEEDEEVSTEAMARRVPFEVVDADAPGDADRPGWPAAAERR